MIRRILPLVFSALAFAGVLQAQEEGRAVEISSMTVDVWPEYDDPRVLVIQQGELASPSEVPTEFTFVVPRTAQVHMAGGVTEDGKHVHAEFRTVERGDGLIELRYTLEVPHFYMEFYYDPFAGGEDRAFTYPLLSPHLIDELAVRVQEPRRAEEFTVEPFTSEVVQDSRGFAYRVVKWDGVPPDAAREVSVSYRKADREPSVAPPEPERADAGAAPTGWPPERILMISGLLLLALAGYGIAVWSRGSPPEPEPASARARNVEGASETASPREVPASPPAEAQRHCTRCGGAVAPTDRYCAVCGTPTRRATVA